MPLTPEEIAESLAEADRLYELSQLEDDGQLIDPATMSMPNLAGSRVIEARVIGRVHDELTAIAAEAGTTTASVVRAAIHQYLQNCKEEGKK